MISREKSWSSGSCTAVHPERQKLWDKTTCTGGNSVVREKPFASKSSALTSPGTTAYLCLPSLLGSTRRLVIHPSKTEFPSPRNFYFIVFLGRLIDRHGSRSATTRGGPV